MSVLVTTWYLQQSSAAELRPAAAPGRPVEIARSGVPLPEFSRFLYTAVGGDVRWTDRLAWPYERWASHLGRPGVETWVAYEDGTPAGFVELAAGPEGAVEIVCFGLLPAFRGRGVGGRLLHEGAARAWDLGGRWPGLGPTRRVWLHTCSKDGPYALDNYRRRGFTVYDTVQEREPETANPGPWPGARRP
ncbi:GNAT family N-acetyltransferase [Streptomyces sp. NPDC050560]|uniref:GNAT family N-acetyltransferase n=1 Tax=Streptomyces sp. NPDC050560 TaxID=3365630 RepID=UPI00379E7071